MPTIDTRPGPWAWLTGYTCTAHRITAGTGEPVANCACKPSLLLRAALALGLSLELAPSPEPRWCAHTWPANTQANQVPEDHCCELPHGHGAPEHVCDCGAHQLTDHAADRLLRLIRTPQTYDTCLWPEDTPCPRHDRADTWPAGRDCTGTCTNCNSTSLDWHAPSCPHYASPSAGAAAYLPRNPDRKDQQ